MQPYPMDPYRMSPYNVGPSWSVQVWPNPSPPQQRRPPMQPESQPDGPWGSMARPEVEVPVNLANKFGNGESGTYYYVIWSFDRELRKTSRATNDVPDPGDMMPASTWPPVAEEPRIRQRGDLREAFVPGPFGMRVLVGRSVARIQAELSQLPWLLAATGSGVLVVGLAGGWILSIRAVRPIKIITAAAQEITASNLSRRINAEGTKSELGRLAIVLNETFARLEATFQQQVRFTADASHELRTPLAVIHTHAQLALSRDRTAEEYHKTIETCLRASGRMKNLVETLLILAKIDAGRLSLEKKPFNLRDAARESVAMVESLAEESEVSLQSELQDVELTADPARIIQVATNLLTNAIRYNRPGGSVRVAVFADGSDAAITVADTGVGIPAESQPHVFERFYRVNASRNREDGGSGLGLAICKSIVDAHDGVISFQSEVGVGTTFIVRLPRANR
jgi:two-component system, OmpR family, sensor kinase